MYKEKHPMNDLTNTNIVREILYDLEDTDYVVVDIIDDDAQLRDIKVVSYYEMSKGNPTVLEDDCFTGYTSFSAVVEHRCEVYTNPKVALITIKKDIDSYYMKSDEVIILDRSEIISETIGRLKEYLGDDLVRITKSWEGDAFNHISQALIAIQFTSYEVIKIL